MKYFFLLFVFSLILLTTTTCFEFNENGEFTIVQFTDFHCGQEPEKDYKTQEFERDLLN